jgi:hypothetical protein
MSRRSGTALPAFLASPMLADRVAVEIAEAAAAVQGDGPMASERRTFLAAVAVQVEAYGTEAVSRQPVEPTEIRPGGRLQAMETRDEAADAG